MTRLFKKLFIKNYKDVENPKVRASYGVAAGVLGIIANTLLFAVKLFVGILSASVAVIADAFNNFTDFMSSIITMVGFKLSGMPADKEHPFGHARFEYITGLIVACVIFFIGFETGKASIEKIINGGGTDFSYLTIAILGFAIIVKVCLAIIFKGLGKSIDSDSLKVMSADSRNDVITTSVVLISAIIGMVFNVSIDGYLGVAVSIFVLFSAFMLIKETIHPLLGTSPDKEVVENIKNKLCSYSQVLDIHDLIVHNYGPAKTFATVHIEVDSKVDIMVSHELADNIERDFYKDLGVLLVCHLDPVNVGDEETLLLRECIENAIKENDLSVKLHDFRVVKGKAYTNVIFDAVIPFGEVGLERKIRELVESKLATFDKKYYAVIEFERDYNE